MKKIHVAFITMSIAGFVACQKTHDNTSQISLTPSASVTSVGQTMSVTLSASTNASNWTVSPASTATKMLGITTSKVNYFTFSKAGVYTVSVRVRSIAYDPTQHQSLDSCWNHGNGARGGCTQGVDTTSTVITVKG